MIEALNSKRFRQRRSVPLHGHAEMIRAQRSSRRRSANRSADAASSRRQDILEIIKSLGDRIEAAPLQLEEELTAASNQALKRPEVQAAVLESPRHYRQVPRSREAFDYVRKAFRISACS